MTKQRENRIFLIDTIARTTLGCVLMATMTGCTGTDPKAEEPPARIWGSESFCDAPFSMTTVASSLDLMRASPKTEPKIVTLKSSLNFGYDESAYNLSDGCFSRKGGGCEVSDQMHFNHGGSPDSLQYRGRTVVLSPADSSKFDSIDFPTLDSLNLKSVDGLAITKASLFNRHVGSQLNGDWPSDSVRSGSTALVLLEDPFYSRKYQLYKIKIVNVQPGNQITISHQRIAEADDDAVRNFICSRRSILQSVASKGAGEATVTADAQTGFDFETSLDRDDRRYIGSKSHGQIWFERGSQDGSASALLQNNPYDSSQIIAVGDKALEEISRSSWPSIRETDANPRRLSLKENTTYLLSHFDETRSLFVAIRVLRIDGTGVHFQWKRFAREPAQRVANFVLRATSTESTSELATIEAASSFQQIDRDIIYNGERDTLIVENRTFPTYVGIVDVTTSYISLDVIPPSVNFNLQGVFKDSERVRLGARYVIAVENFSERTVLAFEVVGFIPGKSVTVRYKKLASFVAH